MHLGVKECEEHNATMTIQSQSRIHSIPREKGYNSGQDGKIDNIV